MIRNLFFLIFILFQTVSFSQNLKADGKKIIDGNGNEVLLKGYAPGGWLLIEGYMMHETDGSVGAQHEIKEKLTDLMGSEKTEEFFKKWRENHFTKRDVDSLAAWGFNSIRVPLHYNLFTLPIQDEPNSGQNTWLDVGFNIIDNILDWAKPHEMYVILDLHAAPGGQGRNTDISDMTQINLHFGRASKIKVKLLPYGKKLLKDIKTMSGLVVMIY